MPEQSQQVTLRALGDERVRGIVERYIEAWERGDMEAIAAMLAEDAKFAMQPYPMWWRGRDVIAAFAAEPVHRYLPTYANGQRRTLPTGGIRRARATCQKRWRS
jgi:RNA polymerase sigma-70 factor (ECF subfamily)